MPTSDQAEPPALPPSLPYVAVIFTSRRKDGDASSYDQAAARMAELATTAPGYLGHRSARGEDGVGITVSYWRTTQDADAFRRLPLHKSVQATGRSLWYDWYVSEVAVVERVRASP